MEERLEEDQKKIKTDELEKLKEEFDIIQKDLDEKDDRLKRLMAEFENFKKRNLKERENLYNTLVGDIFLSLLPILDNLEKAVQTHTDDENYKQGIELVLKQYKDVLEANGVKEIPAVGNIFDPELHEAISSVVDENLEVKEIKEEFRKGYIAGNRVIRHSLVVVAN